MNIRFLKIFSLIGLLGFAACEKDALNDFDPEADKAKLMVVYTNPSWDTLEYKSPTDYKINMPGANLYLDDTRLFTAPLRYPNYTGYFATEPGTRSIRLDTVFNQAHAPILERNLDLQADKFYTYFVVDETEDVDGILLEDNLQPINRNSEKALVRFVNVSPDSPAIDLVSEDGNVLFSNIPFKNFVDFTEKNSGTLRLQVKNHATGDILFPRDGSFYNYKIDPGKMYTFYITGYTNPRNNDDGNAVNPLDFRQIINYYIYP